jgi:hypothetical protein
MNTFAKVTPDTLPTKKQLECLRAFHRLVKSPPPTPQQVARVMAFLSKYGNPPTQRQLAVAMGIDAENGARPHIDGCIERGLISESLSFRIQYVTPRGIEWL